MFLSSAEQKKYFSRKIQSDPSFKGAYGRSLIKTLYFNQFGPKDLRNHICMDIFMTIPVIIHAVKNFYLLDALNDNIDALKAGGLIDYWNFQYVDKRYLNSQELESAKVLMFYQLEGCFKILMFGCIASFAVFMCEFFVAFIDIKIFFRNN